MGCVGRQKSFIHFREEATAIVKRSCSVRACGWLKAWKREHEVRTEASHVNHGHGGRQRLAGNVIVQITMSAVRHALRRPYAAPRKWLRGSVARALETKIVNGCVDRAARPARSQPIAPFRQVQSSQSPERREKYYLWSSFTVVRAWKHREGELCGNLTSKSAQSWR